jgi:hypothetical protein
MEQELSLSKIIPLTQDHCSHVLTLYAKKYQQDPENNKNALTMFEKLIQQHEKSERFQAVGNVLDMQAGSTITLEHCVKVYAGNLCSQEIQNLNSLIPSLRIAGKKAIIKQNSAKMKRFLLGENLLAVKTLLLTDLPLDCHWSGHKYDRKRCNKYGFDHYNKKTLWELTIDCGDLNILSSLVKVSEPDGVCYAIAAMKKWHKIDLLDAFISQHHDLVHANRFAIWREIIGENYSRDGAPHDDEMKYQIFKKIAVLLFADDINEKDTTHAEYPSFRSPLLYAVADKDYQAVLALLDLKADPNTTDKDKDSALYHAYKSPKITQLLLDHGANIRQRNSYGRSALVSAVSHGYSDKKETVEALLKAGADVNAIDDQGRSALHRYAERLTWGLDQSLLDIVSLLIEWGADVDLPDKDGKTIRDHAQEVVVRFNNKKALETLDVAIQKRAQELREKKMRGLSWK